MLIERKMRVDHNVSSFVRHPGRSGPAGRLHSSKGRRSGAWTRSLGVQFRAQGIRRTEFCRGLRDAAVEDWLVKDEAAKKLRLARKPDGRFGKPDEVVSLAAPRLDESSWTNGASPSSTAGSA